MLRVATLAGLCALAVSLGFARQGQAAERSAQRQSCADRATQQGLEGKARDTFTATCERGSLAPKHPTSDRELITAPSGADRTVRSRQCNREAARRGLKEGALQAFRKGCLASAAPVDAIQTSHRVETPTHDKPKLDAQTDAPVH